MRTLKLVLILYPILCTISSYTQTDARQKSAQSSTKLYLCGLVGYSPGPPNLPLTPIVTGNHLQRKPCAGMIKTVYLWSTDNDTTFGNQAISFSYELDGDVPGGTYEVALDLGTEEDKGEKCEVEINIKHMHGKSERILARKVVVVTSSKLIRFKVNLDAADPGAKRGDKLILFVKNLSAKTIMKFRYGDSTHLGVKQCYVQVPW